jgi:hypothetical protein
MRSPGPPFIVSSRGPRSNTPTASPYPVRAKTSTSAPIYQHFHHYCYAERNGNTLQKAREGTSVQRMQIETSGCAEIHFARVAEKRAFCRQRRSQQGSLVAPVNAWDSVAVGSASSRESVPVLAGLCSLWKIQVVARASATTCYTRRLSHLLRVRPCRRAVQKVEN